MKKVLYLTLVLIMLSYNICFSANYGYVNCNLLNVRASSNTSSEIVTQIKNNTQVEIVYTEPGWHNIRLDNGITGFVYAQYISKTATQMKEAANSAVGNQIASEAHNYIGSRYVYGSSGPNAFDCSGFTSYLFNKYGVSLPRRSIDQGAFGTYVEKDNLTTGDLVFFSNRSDRTINHVGIYVGNDNFIHASTSVRGVVMDKLSSNYYTKNYICGRRVL